MAATKTKPKPEPTEAKPTATQTDAELETTLAAAKIDHEDARQRAAEHRGRIAELRGHLQRRNVDHPDNFGPTGEPMPNTGAAKLSSQIDDLVTSDGFNQVLRGHEVRVREAEEALNRHRQRQARELLRELEPDARKAVEKWTAWADEGEAHLMRLLAVGGRATALAHRSPDFDPRDVPTSDGQSRALKDLRAPLPLPLPRAYVAERAEEAGSDG
jgi:hypothetical protein